MTSKITALCTSILLKAIDITLNTKADVMCEFNGMAKCLNIYGYKEGFNVSESVDIKPEWNQQYSVYLDYPDAESKLIVLSEILDEVQKEAES